MSALPTPKLADLDDPLAPRRDPAPAAAAPQAPAAQTPPRRREAKRASANGARRAPAARTAERKPSLADEPLIAVFARLPESLSDRLDEGVQAVNAGRPRRARVSKQDVLGALVDELVTPDDPARLVELVDAYRKRLLR